MTVKPKFYDSFKCIASDCPDTCCAGWEIDVDRDTAEYYDALGGEVGEYVRSKLLRGDGVQLCREGERCRFLREDNLCELILRVGEDALCDICREHPRFFLGSDNITEVGVGLCCPEAARLWLTSECGFVLEDDGAVMSADERETLERQMYVIERLSNGVGTLGGRLSELLGYGAADYDLYPSLRRLYSSLEVLDAHFSERFSESPTAVSDVRLTRLAVYFVYRYYFELGEELCLRFCAASLIMIAAMGGELTQAAKDYSKEVEYDPDNLDKLYAFLTRCSALGTLCREVLL